MPIDAFVACIEQDSSIGILRETQVNVGKDRCPSPTDRKIAGVARIILKSEACQSCIETCVMFETVVE